MHWLENLCFENSKQHLKIHDKYFYAAQVLQKLNFLLVFLILCFAKQRFLLKDAKGKEVFSIREDYYTKEIDNNTIVCPRNYRSSELRELENYNSLICQ